MKKFTDEHAPKVQDFVETHRPKVPNFIEENLPRFGPQFVLGPPSAQRKDPSLLDAYFNGDPSRLLLDAAQRPDHYTDEQKKILEALEQKQPLPPGTSPRELSELVLRFTERTEHRQKREAIVQRAQKKLEDDPTVKRKEEEDREREEREKAEGTFEAQNFPKAIKII